MKIVTLAEKNLSWSSTTMEQFVLPIRNYSGCSTEAMACSWTNLFMRLLL